MASQSVIAYGEGVPEDQRVQIGDYVRSYDFEHRTDCYVEGTVISYGYNFGCKTYEIVPSRFVWHGEEQPLRGTIQRVFPPLNGLRIAGRPGDTTRGVVKTPRPALDRTA